MTLFCKFTNESISSGLLSIRILKIGEHMAKLWAKVCCLCFFLTRSSVTRYASENVRAENDTIVQNVEMLTTKHGAAFDLEYYYTVFLR